VWSYTAHIEFGRTKYSAAQIFTKVRAKFGKVFPPLFSNNGRNSGVKLLEVGQVLKLSVLGLYGVKGLTGSVQITQITKTSFSFRPLPDHPDYPGEINFAFHTVDGSAFLGVTATSSAEIPGGGDLDRYALVGRTLWWVFGQNIQNEVLN
jgi:hypothetical protein